MTSRRSRRRRSNGNSRVSPGGGGGGFFAEQRLRKMILEQRANRSAQRARGGPGLNCLVLGGGGREYAIAWRLARSEGASMIDVVPGNPGLALFTRVLDFPVRDTARLQQHLAAAQIDLAIVGPDDLVADGVADALRRGSIAVVGPSRDAAKIEWSKTFAKEHMRENGEPTALWETFAGAAEVHATLVQ